MHIEEQDRYLAVFRGNRLVGSVDKTTLELTASLRSSLDLQELLLVERYLLLRRAVAPTPLEGDEMATLPMRIRQAAAWFQSRAQSGSTAEKLEGKEFVEAMFLSIREFELALRQGPQVEEARKPAFH